MQVSSKPFSAREEILFSEDTSGHVTIRYIADFDFKPPLAWMTRYAPGMMDRLGKATMRGMKRALEQRFEPPRGAPCNVMAAHTIIPNLIAFSRFGYTRSRRRWNPLSSVMTGKHIVITGVTSGLGEAAAMQLGRLGAKLTLVARDRERAERVRTRIVEDSANTNVVIEIADLSSISQTHQLADRLIERGEAIDILINNAGALFNQRQLTEEGLERSFALLLLSPYTLTERVLPLLKQSQHARVINVSSGGMYTQRLRVRDLQSERGPYNGSVAYARAKRALVILSEEWAIQWREFGIDVHCMHPGWADTPGVQTALPGFRKLTQRILRDADQGADTIVWLAAAPEVNGLSGLFWLDRTPQATHVRKATIENASDRVTLLKELEQISGEYHHSARDEIEAVLD